MKQKHEEKNPLAGQPSGSNMLRVMLAPVITVPEEVMMARTYLFCIAVLLAIVVISQLFPVTPAITQFAQICGLSIGLLSGFFLLYEGSRPSRNFISGTFLCAGGLLLISEVVIVGKMLFA